MLIKFVIYLECGLHLVLFTLLNTPQSKDSHKTEIDCDAPKFDST